MASKFTELVVDCRDPVALGGFWAAVLGWDTRAGDDDDEVEVFDPAGSSPALLFQTVPEGKSVFSLFTTPSVPLRNIRRRGSGG
jgi:hypothetical protein